MSKLSSILIGFSNKREFVKDEFKSITKCSIKHKIRNELSKILEANKFDFCISIILSYKNEYQVLKRYYRFDFIVESEKLVIDVVRDKYCDKKMEISKERREYAESCGYSYIVFDECDIFDGRKVLYNDIYEKIRQAIPKRPIGIHRVFEEQRKRNAL